MAKVLRCGDLVPGCKAVIEGKDVTEVMAKGAEHAKKEHGMATASSYARSALSGAGD